MQSYSVQFDPKWEDPITFITHSLLLVTHVYLIYQIQLFLKAPPRDGYNMHLFFIVFACSYPPLSICFTNSSTCPLVTGVHLVASQHTLIILPFATLSMSLNHLRIGWIFLTLYSLFQLLQALICFKFYN